MGDRPAPADQVTFWAGRDQNLRALAQPTAVGPYRLRFREAARLHAIYVDTPELTLTRYGVALRLQRHARKWEAIVERLGGADDLGQQDWAVRAPLAKPPRLPFTLPDGPLRVRLCALVAERPLNVIVRVERRRRHFDVFPPGIGDDAPAVAELTRDQIRVYAPDERQPYARYLEATVRRSDGGRDDLTQVAELLRHECGLSAQTESTLASALRSRYGAALVAVGEPVILASDSVETAARKIVGRNLRRLWKCDPGTRIGDDPEALHDMRVAVRRLRAAVRVFAPGFPVRLQQRFTEHLQWLGEITTGVRDLDVQLVRLHRHSAALPLSHRAGLVSLRDYMQADRTRLRSQLLAALDSARYFDLLVRLEGFAYGPSRTRPQDATAHERIARAGALGIRRALRRLLKRGAEIRSAPTPEDLHTLRIRAKRLRYLLEFLQELTGKRGGRLVKHLVRLQDLLGTYHDAIVTVEIVRQYAEGPGAQLGAASLLTLGAVASSAFRVAEDKCRDFERTWQRFTRKRTRKEFRVAVRQLMDLGVVTPQDTGDAKQAESPPEPPAPTDPAPSVADSTKLPQSPEPIDAASTGPDKV